MREFFFLVKIVPVSVETSFLDYSVMDELS